MASRPLPDARKLLACLGLIAFLTGATACGADDRPVGQIHFRTGPISGAFTGAQSGSFSVPTPLDFDYEHFSSSRSSWIVRAILANDTTNSRVAYAYSGVGYRWYFWSRSNRVSEGTQGEFLELQPRRRYYYGLDFGVSQVLLKTIGPILEIRTALLDYGPAVGVIQQVTRQVGIEVQLGYTLGMGFSAVSSSGSTMRTLVGISYYY